MEKDLNDIFRVAMGEALLSGKELSHKEIMKKVVSQLSTERVEGLIESAKKDIKNTKMMIDIFTERLNQLAEESNNGK